MCFSLPDHAIPCRMPFDYQSKLIGYLFAICIQCIFLTYVFIAMTTMISILFACYLFGISLTDDIKTIVHSIDKNSKTKRYRLHISAQFKEFIDFHSDVKQLSRYEDEQKKLYTNVILWLFVYFRIMTNLSDIFQPLFMNVFLRNLLTLSAAMLLIQLELVEYLLFNSQFYHFFFP